MNYASKARTNVFVIYCSGDIHFEMQAPVLPDILFLRVLQNAMDIRNQIEPAVSHCVTLGIFPAFADSQMNI